MSDYRARLHQEPGDLYMRIGKLKTFILSDEFERLSEIDRADFKEQLQHMEAYFSVLQRRLSRACGNA